MFDFELEKLSTITQIISKKNIKQFVNKDILEVINAFGILQAEYQRAVKVCGFSKYEIKFSTSKQTPLL